MNEWAQFTSYRRWARPEITRLDKWKVGKHYLFMLDFNAYFTDQ